MLDRLFRDAEDALRQTKAWDKAGIVLHLVDMGASMNTASAMGRMFLTLMAGCAELERKLVAERTASVLAHKKQHGRAAIGSDSMLKTALLDRMALGEYDNTRSCDCCTYLPPNS